MSKAPTIALTGEFPTTSSVGGKLRRGLINSSIYEKVLCRAVTACFVGIAFDIGMGLIVRMRELNGGQPSVLDITGVADVLARACLLLFFLIAAWLTLARSVPLAKAQGMRPRVAALAGATLLFALNFLPRLDDAPAWLLFLSAGLALLGNGLSIYVLHRLGRSFSVMPQARALVTRGPYKIVRHPLYLTEEIAIIGIFLPYASLLAALLFGVHFAMQVLRIRYEEEVLSEVFPEYAAYARHTARLIPGFW